ncbi:MAG: hypothetical protein GY865_10310 [candidate division Zixibacteria bacterium]|nr:hypothetical protein [candidate division Zixibacteria bacterium]
MKKVKKISILSIVLIFTLIVVGKIYSDTELTEEYQIDLYDRLNHLSGEGPVPASLENLERHICGTSAAFEAFINRDRLGSAYKTSAVMQGRDTSLSYAYSSPSGHFLIHYDITGNDAVYGSDVDTLAGGDGIPDYINKVGEIMDSVWVYTIDDLGFPPPPADDFYPAGLDAAYDVYIEGLGSSYYGATYSEMVVTPQSATSVLVLDNDYNFYPYNEYNGDPRDFDRRLDAVRVTAAHEFFHAVHFGMDWTEWEGDDAMFARIYWWEMTAVWMEEMMYDDINDYYGYLPSFFELPWIGLRNFNTSAYPLALHPYGAAVFPIFLTERWGDPTIVRRIWEECRDLGIGPQFGEAVDNAVVEISGGTHDLTDAIREFSVWNMFTGNRANRAPDGIGYSEREFYSVIPDTAMFSFDGYPIRMTNRNVLDSFNTRLPETYGSNIINLENIYSIPDSLGFYFYSSALYSDIDWNVSLIGIPLDDNSDATVQMNQFEGSEINKYMINDTDELYNVMAVITPVLNDVNAYNFSKKFDYSFAVLDSIDDSSEVVNYEFKTYPNPCTPEKICESIKFEIEKSSVDVVNSPASLSIVILNSAGEKVRTLYYDFESPSSLLNFITVFTAEWDMKNESGYDVSSGVYMAYIKLAFTDFSDSEPMIYKSKFAVIR